MDLFYRKFRSAINLVLQLQSRVPLNPTKSQAELISEVRQAIRNGTLTLIGALLMEIANGLEDRNPQDQNIQKIRACALSLT
jgi:hypothetical protein